MITVKPIKKIVLAAFLLAGIMASDSVYPQKKIALAVGGGMSFPLMDKTFRSDYRAGFNIHTGLMYVMNDINSVMFDFQLNNFMKDNSDGTFPQEKLNIFSFKFSTQFGSLIKKRVNFYGKIGVGLFILTSSGISETNLGLTGGGGMTFGIDKEKRLYGYTEITLDYNTGKSPAKGYIPFRAGIFLLL